MITNSGMRVRRLLLQFGGYALVFLFGAACMFFTMKSGFPGDKEQPTQPTSGFARSESCIPTTQPHVEPVQVQMASLYSSNDTAESSGTTGHTPKYTYEEIVTDPEFLGYSKDTQLAILISYFEDKGIDLRPIDSYFGRENTKFYRLGLRDRDTDLVSVNLLISVLSPSVLNGLGSDRELQLILPQYCKYYLPLYDSDLILKGVVDELNETVEQSECVYGQKSFYYVPGLSLQVCELLADKAVECGETRLGSDSMSLDDSAFHIRFLVEE